MEESLKKQAFLGVGWNAVGRFSIQGVNFIMQIILARLLAPSDYGIIAMMAIFLQVAGVFVDSGFANALIQKQDCDEKDYSTVFYYNLVVSIGVYGVLFLIAPFVARFYQMNLITDVMRVSSFVVIINALSIVQRTKLIKIIDFKSQTIVSFVSSLLSGLGGVVMALHGLGVWSLCAQSLLNSLFQLFLFYLFVKWHPKLVFSKDSFRTMFCFGSKILVASIISVIYNNLYTIVIGKRFNSKELGYYSRADQFALFPSSNIGNIINSVAFPTLSKIQSDDYKLKIAYRKIIRYSSFVIFPLMIGLSAVSDSMIRSLLGEKWIDTIPLLQILCYALMWDHLSLLNLNLLYVKGKSNLVLRLEIFKKTLATIILLSAIPFGIMAMCWSRVIYGMFAFYINSYFTNKLINLSFWNQVLDFLPYLALSILMGSIIVLVNNTISMQPTLTLIVGIAFGGSMYLILSMILFKEIREEILLVFSKIKI